MFVTKKILGHDRNAVFAYMLFQTVHDHPTLECIELTFLELSDSMRAETEKASDLTKVYWPNDLVNIVTSAKRHGKPYKVNYLTFRDFKMLKDKLMPNVCIAADETVLN
jgi:hypothetical protein